MCITPTLFIWSQELGLSVLASNDHSLPPLLELNTENEGGETDLGCGVDYEPHLGSVELEDHEMFKSGGRVPQRTQRLSGCEQ